MRTQVAGRKQWRVYWDTPKFEGGLSETQSCSLLVAVAAAAAAVVGQRIPQAAGCKLPAAADMALGTRWEGLTGHLQQEEPGSAESADIHSSAAAAAENTRNQAAESALAAAVAAGLVGHWEMGKRSKEIATAGKTAGSPRAAVAAAAAWCCQQA